MRHAGVNGLRHGADATGIDHRGATWKDVAEGEVREGTYAFRKICRQLIGKICDQHRAEAGQAAGLYRFTEKGMQGRGAAARSEEHRRWTGSEKSFGFRRDFLLRACVVEHEAGQMQVWRPAGLHGREPVVEHAKDKLRGVDIAAKDVLYRGEAK